MRSWKKSGDGWEPCGSLPLFDRGFRYGMGVFETIAVRNGRPLLWRAHLERLARAVRDCGCEMPPLPPFDFLKTGSGLLRYYLTAGPGSPEDPFKGDAYALFEEAEVGWSLPPARVESRAAPYLPRPGGWKTGNYWQNIDAFCAARREGGDEALLFNPAGMLVGAAMANVFLQIDGRWVTPALETGTRDGAVRAWVLESIEADEQILNPEALGRVAAAFLTNSRIGVRPVAVMDGRPLMDASREIQQRYFDEVYSR